jgi:L-amino acid N-acyltransferase YncA
MPDRLKFLVIESMIFRDARIEDLSAIMEIYNSTIPSRMVTADTEPVRVEDRIEWFYKHSPRKRPLWVLENENKNVIAWIAFHSFYGRKAYEATAEISIYIHEDHRGKGLGKKVLAHAISKSEDMGIKTMLGYIFAHNEASLKLFHSFGFTDWGNLPNVAVLDGIERSLIIVGKRIRK